MMFAKSKLNGYCSIFFQFVLLKGTLLVMASVLVGAEGSYAQNYPQNYAQNPNTAESLSEPPAELPAPAEPNLIPPAPILEEPALNPLEPQPDPLIPEMAVDRPLSPQEQDVLRAALEELRRQGEARLEAGDLPGALELWNRELRLRRYLGPRSEVESLARVGQVAWGQSQATELRYITLRLEQIEQEAWMQPEVDYLLLDEIARTYEQVRARSQAVALYTRLLERAKQQQDLVRQQQILTAVAEQHLSWFDYPNAAAAYEALLVLNRETGNGTAEVQTLTQLAYIYQENNQPEQAIAAQQQLVETYRQQQNFQPIPALKIAMADSYVLLNRPDLAAVEYQEAFAVARSVQQFGYASDALQKLATLYQSLNRLDDALIVYQLLLDVERQSYNSFGMMNTYDRLGQLYKVQGNTLQARVAFQQGLQLAQQLKYRVDYFSEQIQAIGP